MQRLFDYLNCFFWTFDFAGSADYALFRFHWNRLLVFNLEDFHRTSVYACAAASTFIVVNLNFHQSISSLFGLDSTDSKLWNKKVVIELNL